MKVKFYMEPSREVLAVFQTETAEFNGYRPNNLTCYSHTGQHSQLHKEYLKKCRLAKPEEYAELKREMESIGYELEVANQTRKEATE